MKQDKLVSIYHLPDCPPEPVEPDYGYMAMDSNGYYHL